MPAMTLGQAINAALRQEMRRDDRVVLLGEDIGELGGVFRVTAGLLDEFGDQRVIETPLADGGAVGAAVGMALYGLRPVVEVQFADFLFGAFDQVVSEVARIRYRSGGAYECPLVLRAPYGAGLHGGPYLSQSPEAYLAHTPGLVVAVPAEPTDAAGLLRAALRGRDPVVLLEPKALYASGDAEVHDDVTTPLGSARVVREGTDVSVFAYGAMVVDAAEAAAAAAADGVDVELVDLRTLAPVDIATVLASVVKTGRAVIVSEAPRFGGYAATLAAEIGERALWHLEAPVARVCGTDTPVPYRLEETYLPDAGRIAAAIEQVANF